MLKMMLASAATHAFGSVPAQAVVYATYSLYGTADGVVYRPAPPSPTSPSFTAYGGPGPFSLDFTVQLSPPGNGAPAFPGACYTVTLVCQATFTGNTIHFYQYQPSAGGSGHQFDVTLCLTGPTSLATASANLTVAAGCSSGSLNQFEGYDFGFVAKVLTVDFASVRVFDSATVPTLGGNGSYTPEPATWAMMIAGMGIAGVALRRRRVRLAAA